MILAMALAAAALAASVAGWAFTRYAPGPIRRRARHQMAQHAQNDPTAKLTLWDGRLRGGIGVITCERGSVQARYARGVYQIEWFGRQGHPVAHDSLETPSVVHFNTRLTFWTSRMHLAAGRAGGPGLSS